MNIEDYQNLQNGLLRTIRGPYEEAQRLQRMFKDMTQPSQQLLKLMDLQTRSMIPGMTPIEPAFQNVFQKELEQQRQIQRQMRSIVGDIAPMEPALQNLIQQDLEQQKWIATQMRPVLGEINAMKSIGSSLGVDPAVRFLGDYTLSQEAMGVPNFLKEAIGGIASEFQQATRMPREIEQLLAGLAPYAAETPTAPTAEVLEAIRSQVAELSATSADRISDALAGVMRWLLANAPTIDRKTVSFVVLNVIFPLVLCIYQPEIQRAVRPRDKRVQREVIQRVNQVAIATVPAPALASLRYVSVEALAIRSTSRTNSSRVSTLHLGDVIVVIAEKKDWTYIEYHADDVQIRGWAYTRYLKRFAVSKY
jgi:hypothetical protein